VTFEEALVAFWKADAGIMTLVTGIWPDASPQAIGFPRITYTMVDMPQVNTLTGPIGMPYPRIQVDCWGQGKTGKADIVAVAEAVRKSTGPGAVKFDGFSGLMSGIKIWRIQLVDRRDSIETPEDATELPIRRRSLDFKVTFVES
jgi:hypothetical protein